MLSLARWRTNNALERPSWPLALTKFVDITDFGARGDWRAVTDVAIATATNIVTSATAAFRNDDVGKIIKIRFAAANFADLVATITGFTSATTVAISVNATHTIAAGLIDGAIGVSAAGTAIFATDDTTAIQAAIDSLYTSNTGPGFGVVLVPPGYFPTTSTITINPQYAKIRLEGFGFGQSVIEHLGAASNGAIYVNGPLVGSQSINANWFEISRLAIGSLNGHGINILGAANSLISDVWITTAGTAVGTAYLRIQNGFATKYRGVRMGGGDMGGGAGWAPPFSALSLNTKNVLLAGTSEPDYGVYATNDVNNLVVQQDFQDCHLHGYAKVAGFAAVSSGGSAMFDIRVSNSRFRTDPSTWPASTSFLFDSCAAQVIASQSEIVGGGTGVGVTVKKTVSAAQVHMIGFQAINLTLAIDTSGAGSGMFIETADCEFYQVTKSGAGAKKWVAHNLRVDVDHAAGILDRGFGIIVGDFVAGTLYAYEDTLGRKATL